MGLLSRLLGRDDDRPDIEYTVGDDGTDYDIQDDDAVDLTTGEVFYNDDGGDDPDEYDESNSNGFDYQQQFHDQAAVCGACGHYQQFDKEGNVYCGCPDDEDDFD